MNREPMDRLTGAGSPKNPEEGPDGQAARSRPLDRPAGDGGAGNSLGGGGRRTAAR